MKNVTFIDDLFDTDSLMMGGNGKSDFISKGNAERDEYSNQVHNRHIRKHDNKDMSFAINGGMMSQPPMQMQMPQQMPQQFMFEEQQPVRHIRQQIYEPEEISCMTIANHIKECPICSKFYNCDNSMYIVCIVLLIMVCVILLKRIIEK